MPELEVPMPGLETWPDVARQLATLVMLREAFDRRDIDLHIRHGRFSFGANSIGVENVQATDYDLRLLAVWLNTKHDATDTITTWIQDVWTPPDPVIDNRYYYKVGDYPLDWQRPAPYKRTRREWVLWRLACFWDMRPRFHFGPCKCDLE